MGLVTLGRLSFHIERNIRFHGKPFFELWVEDDPWLQEYYDSVWHVCMGWLWFVAEFNWGA